MPRVPVTPSPLLLDSTSSASEDTDLSDIIPKRRAKHNPVDHICQSCRYSKENVNNQRKRQRVPEIADFERRVTESIKRARTNFTNMFKKHSIWPSKEKAHVSIRNAVRPASHVRHARRRPVRNRSSRNSSTHNSSSHRRHRPPINRGDLQRRAWQREARNKEREEMERRAREEIRKRERLQLRERMHNRLPHVIAQVQRKERFDNQQARIREQAQQSKIREQQHMKRGRGRPAKAVRNERKGHRPRVPVPQQHFTTRDVKDMVNASSGLLKEFANVSISFRDQTIIVDEIEPTEQDKKYTREESMATPNRSGSVIIIDSDTSVAESNEEQNVEQDNNSLQKGNQNEKNQNEENQIQETQIEENPVIVGHDDEPSKEIVDKNDFLF